MASTEKGIVASEAGVLRPTPEQEHGGDGNSVEKVSRSAKDRCGKRRRPHLFILNSYVKMAKKQVKKLMEAIEKGEYTMSPTEIQKAGAYEKDLLDLAKNEETQTEVRVRWVEGTESE